VLREEHLGGVVVGQKPPHQGRQTSQAICGSKAKQRGIHNLTGQPNHDRRAGQLSFSAVGCSGNDVGRRVLRVCSGGSRSFTAAVKSTFVVTRSVRVSPPSRASGPRIAELP
jgi:hypothetical protein